MTFLRMETGLERIFEGDKNTLEWRVFFHRDVGKISSGMWMNFHRDGNKITSGMEKTTNHVEGMTQTKPRFKRHDTRVWRVCKPRYEWNVLFVVIVATPVGWDWRNNERVLFVVIVATPVGCDEGDVPQARLYMMRECRVCVYIMWIIFHRI